MADDTQSTPGPLAKPARKTAIMVLAIVLIEAVAIVGVMLFLGGGPAKVSAVDLPVSPKNAEDEKLVETLVLDSRMPNNKSGVSYIYATEIYIQVRKRHLEKVKAEIEQFQNEIKADITALWRSSEPQHFQEPRLETLTRKVYALLDDRFGPDKERNEPIVFKVVIVMSTGFRVDS